MKTIITTILSLGILLGLAPQAHTRGSLSMDAYLSQVREGNGGYRASSLISEGAQAASKEGKLLTRPNAFSEYRYVNDRTPQVFSDAFGDQTITQTATAGVSQKTNFGTEVRAGYRFDDIRLKGVNPAFISSTHYSTASPTVEVTQPLGRNGFGREIRAQKELIRAEASSLSMSERFKMDTYVAEARRAYRDLALARETVAVRQDLLRGGRHVMEWVEGQLDRKLADESDYLQARASIKLRELELKAAVDTERVLARHFNTLRGLDSSKVPEKVSVSLPDLGKILPKEAPVRNDVKVLEESRKALQAQAKIARERNLPGVDLNASVALNSLTPDAGTTFGDSFSENPTVRAGMNVSVPLSFGLTSDVRRGYLAQVKGHEEAIRRQSFENDRAYADLKSRYKEALERLKLARSIEAAEREKYELEEKELRSGRSTTYLVFDFNEDLKHARLGRLSIQAEALAIATELELYLASNKETP